MATVTLTTGVSAPLLGTISIAATLLDQSASTITLQWDTSQHLSGNPSSMLASCDISLDNGLTWIFLCSAGRDQGYADTNSKFPGLAFIKHPLPAVGSTTRMLRASLTTSAQVTTSLQAVLS